MTTSTMRRGLFTLAGTGLVLFAIGVPASAQTFTLTASETSNNLTRFSLSVPVSVSKLHTSVQAIEVRCYLLGAAGPQSPISSMVQTRPVDAQGAYNGTVTMHWNAAAGMGTTSAQVAAATPEQF